MSVLVWTAVVLIGGAGSVLRFYVDGLVSSASGRDFPYGTLVVNLSGAVVLGLLTGLALGHDTALLAGTAAVGSYTTFSTMQVEILKMLGAGAWGLAAGYTAASIAAGYAAVHLATAVVRRVRVRA